MATYRDVKTEIIASNNLSFLLITNHEFFFSLKTFLECLTFHKYSTEDFDLHFFSWESLHIVRLYFPFLWCNKQPKLTLVHFLYKNFYLWFYIRVVFLLTYFIQIYKFCILSLN